MPDGTVVEKTLTRELLRLGELSLGPAEQQRLGLAEHSGDAELRVEGERLVAGWNARTRRLGGEALAERLQEYAQPGWTARLNRRGDTLELTIVQSARSTFVPPGPPPRARMWSPAGERRAARRRRLRADRYRLPDPADYRWTGPVGVHVPTMETFVEQVERGGWDTADLVALRLEAERLSALADYDELLAVDVCDKPFDLVIVDEAHRLAGKGATKTRALVKRLGQDARYLLFLTATPVQNELLDLYRLVELLRPGTFRTEREFIARYVDTASSRRPVRADELRRPRAPFVQPRSTHETRSGGRWQRSATSQATSG